MNARIVKTMEIALVLMGGMTWGVIQVSPAAAGPATPSNHQRYQLTATTLFVDEVQEESWFSNGDEPYAIYALIKPNGGTAAVEVSLSPVGNAIPEGGDLNTSKLLFSGPIDTQIAVAAQAVEHDYSMLGDVEAAARAAAQATLVTELASGTSAPCALMTKIAQALHDGALSVDSVLVDDDDVLGPAQSECVTRTSVIGMPVGSTQFRYLDFAGLDFWGNDAEYEQEFEIRRTQ